MKLIPAKELDFAEDCQHCVFPENIQTPTTEGIGNCGGAGGLMAQEIPKGRGVLRPNSLPDGWENY